MSQQVGIWTVSGEDTLTPCTPRRLDLESRLEDWIDGDIGILDPSLLIIGRQVETSFGGVIDLLCIDASGSLVIVELKRDRTPRDTVAQVLDYASWARDLTNDQITSIAERYLGGAGTLDVQFQQQFNAELPETLNDEHRMLIVSSRLDSSTERIIEYLSDDYGVNINAVSFQFFDTDSAGQLLARVFLIEPDQVKSQVQKRQGGKRRRSLSPGDLEQAAVDAGVGDLYLEAIRVLEPLFKKARTTRSTFGFKGDYDGGRGVLLNLLPFKSSEASGLHFEIYWNRICGAFGLDKDSASEVLPEDHKPWVYASQDDPTWAGFEGNLKSTAELQRLASALYKQENPSLT